MFLISVRIMLTNNNNYVNIKPSKENSKKVEDSKMKANDLNTLVKICLNIAEYYDDTGDKDEKFHGDVLCDTLGYGYRALTGYIRRGVTEIIELQSKYHRANEMINCYKRIADEQREYFIDVFGDEEPYTFNDEDKDKIKEFVQNLMKKYEDD